MTALRALVLAALAFAVVVALGRTPALRWSDAALGDLWMAALGRRGDVDVPVVLIAIDDESLRRNPDPLLFWGPVLARAIAALRARGVTAIGLDLPIAASGETWLLDHGFEGSPAARTWDAPLRSELATGDVVVATVAAPDGAGSACLPLAPELAIALPSADAHLGFANFGEEDDGVLRAFRPVVALGDGDRACPRVHLALQLALRHLGLDPGAESWTLGARPIARDGARIPIAWLGPRGSVPVVSIWKVAEGALTAEEAAGLRGRVAIIGADHAGSQDLWVTPFDRFSGAARRRMSGYEVEANAVTTLVADLRVGPASEWVRCGLLAATALASAALFLTASVRASLGWLLGLAIGWPIAGYLALVGADTLLPGASGVAVGLITFAGAHTARLAEEARERLRLRGVFSAYLAEEVVQELLSEPHKRALGGARREVTIVFSDIRGFTTLSETLTPEEVVELLNAYFERVCPPILAAGGRVDKFIGDAVMAVFGAPVSRPDHARAACAAALGMAEAAQGFRAWMAERFADRGLAPFEVGVGVHTGHAVVGNIGYDNVREYAVIGDAVNTASRLEGMTKELGVRILISEATRAAAGPDLRTGERQEIQVKGRRQSVAVYPLLGVGPPAPPGRDAG